MMSPGSNRLRGFWPTVTFGPRGVYNPFVGHLWTLDVEAPFMILPLEHAAFPPRPPHERFRAELVARVRREIELGAYETPEKLAVALERLQDDAERRQDQEDD